MEIDCPHCGKGIELVGPGELKEEYGWTPAMIQHNRTIPGFPEPVLKFQNRHIYLRSDIEQFQQARSRANVEKALETFMRDLDHLPPGERKEAEELLRKRLGADGGVAPKKRATNGRKRRGRT